MGKGDERPKPPAAEYLRGVQYVDDARLADRITLHQRFSTNPTGWQRWIYDVIAPRARERVLEVGCGAGTLWKANASRLPAELALVLTDISPGMLSAARNALSAEGVQAELEVQDVHALDFADASFDVVVSAHMLYHVTDGGQAIREMRRVLKPGGRAIVATNGAAHLMELDVLVSRYLEDPIEDGLTFTLENGTPQLEDAFRDVERHDYPDGLKVTEALPLVRYILSMPGAERLTADEIARLTAEAEALVADGDGFEVSKSSGAFVCRP